MARPSAASGGGEGAQGGPLPMAVSLGTRAGSITYRRDPSGPLLRVRRSSLALDAEAWFKSDWLQD